VDLADGGVHVHRQRPVTGAGAGRPRPTEDRRGHLVELAGVAEGEPSQERPHGRGGHHPVAEHAGGGSRAQQLHVVDAVPTGDHGVHQRQQLASRMGRTRPVPKIDHLVGDLLDPQPLGQGRGQQQSGAGDRTLVVEGDVDLVQHDMGGWHRKGCPPARGS
jgi:hypothetical protein